MEKKSGDGGAKPATRFGFSWADEVEREEREQQHLVTPQPRRPEAKKEEQGRADPFGAARPREVVLAEKGVDWRARDCELHALAPHRSAAAAPRAFAVEGAPRRARIVSTSAHRATPARRAPRGRDAGGPGRTPHPWRHAADSTPQMTGRGNAPPVSHSAWGGGKRKCAGEEPVASQGRRVFGELNVGEDCGFSIWSAARKNCNSGGSETEGIKATGVVGADGTPSTVMTATEFDESAMGQKRSRGGKRRKGRGPGKNKKQQTQLL